MGLDSYFYKCRHTKPDEQHPEGLEQICELGYMRKAYWLVDWISSNVHEVENGEFMELTLEDCMQLRDNIADYVEGIPKLIQNAIESEEFNNLCSLFPNILSTEDVMATLKNDNWAFEGMNYFLKILDTSIIPEFKTLADDEGIYFNSDW